MHKMNLAANAEVKKSQSVPTLQPIVSTEHLDFGTLRHGTCDTHTLTIGKPLVAPSDFAVSCNEEPTWFSIEQAEQIYPQRTIPLKDYH